MNKVKLESANFDVSDLNEGQKEAFEKMKEYLNDPFDTSLFCLRGYAGTGKTFLVNRVISYANKTKPHWRIAITAPTNKAVRVLRKMSRNVQKKVVYQTIHKLLGLTEQIDNNGKQLFTKKQFDNSSIEQKELVIIDEVSMLDDSLFDEVRSHRGKVKIIFMGDPAQIPPVNKVDCMPFRDDAKLKYDIKEYTLTEIVRQSRDNPIIEAAFQVRSNLKKNYPIDNVVTKLNDKGHGVVRLDGNKKADRDKAQELLNEYFNCPAFMVNPDHAKVIAWRNVTVDKTNSILRTMMYGLNVGKIVKNEKLIANKPILDGDIIVFNTNDEFEVVEFDVANDQYKVCDRLVRLSYYDTLVRFIDEEGDEGEQTIKILHEDSEGEFAKCLEELRQEAIKTKGANRSWLRYYGFMRKFADVNYNLALTCHKAQGSTYKNVFIIEDDIDLNPNIFERNRIKYTAYSRPSDRLFILKK